MTKTHLSRSASLHLLLLAGAWPPILAAQGNFVNLEAPVAKGLTVAQPTSGGTFVIACNADDNSLLIINAANNAVVSRVAVGQSPVSVIYDAPTSRIYTANYLGDSVTALQFPVPGSNPPRADLVGTFFIGDAPTDLCIDQSTGNVIVVCSGSNELAGLVPTTFISAGRERIEAPSGATNLVMQMPWRVLQRPGTTPATRPFVILNQRSGTRRTAVFFPLHDTVGLDFIERVPGAGGSTLVIPNPPSIPPALSPPPPMPPTMGTSNMAMALAPDGRLFVVGNEARNDVIGEPALSVMPTGFVESKMWVASSPPNQAIIKERNLNLNSTFGTVVPAESVSMPTDIVLRTSGTTVQNVYVASFSTDRIVQLNATTGSPDGWPHKVTSVTVRSGYTMAGPRSLAITTVGSTQKLFVLGRLDATVKIFNIAAATGNLSLASTVNLTDPFPLAQRRGQSFLYNARLSGTGKVSCASCHVDGRTDSLAWELDIGAGTPVQIPTALVDETPPFALNWPGNRGPMITQTLQGLRPHPIEVAGADLAPLLTTEPFYWRGRRANFEAFGPAFVALLGGTQPVAADMTAFREFALGIMYPPNPEQPITRTFTGSIGTSGDVASGSGSLRGMKLYHERSLVPTAAGAVPPFAVVGAGNLTKGRSCVQCHSLPTGTNSRITELRGIPTLEQPIKTAQIRGLRAREARYPPFSSFGTNLLSYAAGSLANPFLPVNSDGLFHDGFATNVNDLIHGQFTPIPPDGTGDDVVAFVRQLDTGVAPIVGVPLTVLPGGLGAQTDVAVRIAEEQVEAGNAGLVVRRRIGGTTVNLFYNVLRQLYTDPNNPNSTTVLFRGPFSTSTAPPLLPSSMVAGDLIVLEAVPIGSERRIASPTGVFTVQANSAPTFFTSAASLTGFVAPAMWQPILSLTTNVDVANWSGAGTGPNSVRAATAFHNALAAAGGFGVTNPRHHEAPRRLRVHGTNIQLGAKLDLQLPTGWTAGIPTFPTGFEQATFDLNPVLVAGLPPGEVVFETSATIEPLIIAAIMCGWQGAPGVQTTLDTGSAPNLDPTNHNRVILRVRNENPGAPVGTAITTPLRLK